MQIWKLSINKYCVSVWLCSSLFCIDLPLGGGVVRTRVVFCSVPVLLFLDGSKPKTSQWWAATLIPLKASAGCWLDLLFKHLSQSYPLNAWNPVQGLSLHCPHQFPESAWQFWGSQKPTLGKKTTKESSLITWADTWTTCFHLLGFFYRTLTLCKSFSICRKASFCKAL